MGYYRAGFFDDITGVDIKPMPRYPFKFIQGDALEYLAAHGAEYDVIHASPPCQGYSRLRHLPWLKGKTWPMLIDETRDLLIKTGKVWIIENVSDAPLNGAELCGLPLGLPLIRHRRFESSQVLLFPSCPRHPVIFHGSAEMYRRGNNGGIIGVIEGDAKRALGIDWMTNSEMRQAIPPAYTEYIGRQLLATMERDR